MKEVKEYYNVYNYPKINLYTKQQVKKHYKLITKILSFGNISVKDLKSKKILEPSVKKISNAVSRPPDRRGKMDSMSPRDQVRVDRIFPASLVVERATESGPTLNELGISSG